LFGLDSVYPFAAWTTAPWLQRHLQAHLETTKNNPTYC
jgi:hypothetical protein